MPPPWHGSSPGPIVCGGAQRGISLATGFFTGESRRKPLGARSGKNRLVIKGLRNHDLGVLDSFTESREFTLRKPPSRKPASGSQGGVTGGGSVNEFPRPALTMVMRYDYVKNIMILKR
jgi:hypothetical protein